MVELWINHIKKVCFKMQTQNYLDNVILANFKLLVDKIFIRR